MAKEFHFDLGDSTSGPIGFCATVVAESEQEALDKLIEALPGEYAIDTGGEDIEYINVYFNTNAIRLTDIDDVQEQHNSGTEDDGQDADVEIES